MNMEQRTKVILLETAAFFPRITTQMLNTSEYSGISDDVKITKEVPLVMLYNFDAEVFLQDAN